MAPRREHNMFKMRHQPSITHLNHKIRVLLTLILICVLYRRFLIFSYYITLTYNINQATEQDSWDGNFHLISLYSSLEHLPSNSKNIKEFLCCMTNYIQNKSIDCTKANKIPDLNGMGEVA